MLNLGYCQRCLGAEARRQRLAGELGVVLDGETRDIIDELIAEREAQT